MILFFLLIYKLIFFSLLVINIQYFLFTFYFFFFFLGIEVAAAIAYLYCLLFFLIAACYFCYCCCCCWYSTSNLVGYVSWYNMAINYNFMEQPLGGWPQPLMVPKHLQAGFYSLHGWIYS